MKTGHYFLSFIYVLIFCHIIQADLFQDLLGLNDDALNKNSNSALPVSISSTSNSPPPANHSPSKPNTSSDTTESPNSHPFESHKIPPSVQSSSSPSSPISSDPPPPPPPSPHTPSSEPSTNNSPSSPSPSSSTPPASAIIDSASPSVETPPSQPSKNNNNNNTPHSNSSSPATATTEPSNDTSSKNHSPGNTNTVPSRSSNNNNAKSKNSNSPENNNSTASPSSSVDMSTSSTSPLPDDPSPTSDPSRSSGNGTIAGAILGCVVGLALMAAIIVWCRKRGATRRKNGISNDGFKSTDDYSIDMHPHSSPSPAMAKTVLPGNNNGLMDMSAPMTFDYSRRLVAGANTAPSPTLAMVNPVYADDYHNIQQQQQQQEYVQEYVQEYHQQLPPPQQEYHHQQIQPSQDYHQQEYQQQYNTHHEGMLGGSGGVSIPSPQDLTSDGSSAGGYYYQPELSKWDYDHQQVQNNNYDNYTAVDPSTGMMTDPNANYYRDQHAYKPNAI